MQNNKQKPGYASLSLTKYIQMTVFLPQILSEKDAQGAYALHPGVSSPLTHYWIQVPQSSSPGLEAQTKQKDYRLWNHTDPRIWAHT